MRRHCVRAARGSTGSLTKRMRRQSVSTTVSLSAPASSSTARTSCRALSARQRKYERDRLEALPISSLLTSHRHRKIKIQAPPHVPPPCQARRRHLAIRAADDRQPHITRGFPPCPPTSSSFFPATASGPRSWP